MTVSLKKLCAKKEVGATIHELVEALDIPIAIVDTRERIVWGETEEKCSSKYTVEVGGEAIGWVVGAKKASTIASMLSCFAHQEVEKKSLAREALGKYRELTLLYHISEKIIGSLQIKEVAAVVLEEAQRCIPASSGAVILREERSDRQEILSGFGRESDWGTLLKRTGGIVDRAVGKGRGEIINLVTSETGKEEKPPAIVAMMCVPLKTKNKAIGALAIGSVRPVTYTAEDLKLLSALAGQAASAIEALLHENKLKQSRREAILFRLANQIRYSLELESILETAVTEIRNLLRVDRCLFAWYRPSRSEIKPLEGKDKRDRSGESATGWNPQESPPYLTLHTSDYWEVVKEAKHPDLASLIRDYSTGEVGGLAHKILQHQILRLDDISTILDPVMQQFFLKQETTSIVAVPIETRLGKMGFVACATASAVRPWSDDEVELLQAVANQLAIAIDQAELYEQSLASARIAREQAEQLQTALSELQQTEVQLVQSEKMSGLGQMVAGIAHEINNPVNFIHGNLMHVENYTFELLQALELYERHYPQPNAEIQKALEQMDVEFLMEDLPKLLDSMKLGTARIREIVQSLRIFSRVDEAEMKPIDIREGLESTLTILQHRLNAKPGRLEIHVVKEYEDLPPVECYAGQLNQVFMNLLANAIDAIEEAIEKHKSQMAGRSPTLHIRTQLLTPPDSEADIPCGIRIHIADNGIGMTETVRRRLFDPFFTTKPVGKGTGLGLSISYSIVQKHRGQLYCHSQPDRGTEFIVELPISQLPNPARGCSIQRYPKNFDSLSVVHHIPNP